MVSTNDRIKELQDEINKLKSIRDPYRNFKFKVTLEECTSVVIPPNGTPWSQVEKNLFTWELPCMAVTGLISGEASGPTSLNKVATLKRGITPGNRILANWHYLTPNVSRDVRIEVMGVPSVGQEDYAALTFRLQGAKPVYYEISDLDAGENQLLCETLTVKYWDMLY